MVPCFATISNVVLSAERPTNRSIMAIIAAVAKPSASLVVPPAGDHYIMELSHQRGKP